MTSRFQLMVYAVLVMGVSNASAPAAAQSDSEEVEFIGRYSDVRYTAEHAYGHGLQLWRDGSSYVGLWYRADGHQADFPIVRATDIVWDRRSGSLHFSAKWCDEIQSFDGVLEKARLTGILTSKLPSGVIEVVKLVLNRDDTELDSRPKAAWSDLVERMLARRQPQCQRLNPVTAASGQPNRIPESVNSP